MSDEAALWRHNFKQIMSFVDVAHDNFRAAPNSRGVAEKSVKEGLRRGVFHHLLDEREREAISSAQLRKVVERVRSAVDEFLNEHLTTPQQLVSRLREIASLAGEAVETINEMPDEEDVVQVVDEFESRYLVTLATTMSAHHTLATKLVERKESDGQFFDIATYAFVSEPGPGRVHVAELNNAMDSGAASYSFTRGMVSYDRFPPVQIMIYGQWFAYIHALWDEWYRPRLAAAYSRTLGEEYLRNDIKSAFMGELNKIRNDGIHNKARVKESARNRILDWGTSDGLVGMTPEKMFSLRGSFPRDELLTPPVRGDVSKTQNIPWTADIQLIDSVKQRLAELGVAKRQQKDIGDEMLRLWLDTNSAPAAAAAEQVRGN